MENHPCDDIRENTPSCPVYQQTGGCFVDTHHTQFPRRAFRGGVEKGWRVIDPNKVEVCRALHNAIHASGYRPQKPDRQVMIEAVTNGVSEHADAERQKQISLGRLMLSPEEGVA